MPRFVAFLRGVMPTNCSMPALRACFEAAGFENVKTVLASGNVVFDAARATVRSLEARIEAATTDHLGRRFDTFVRAVAVLDALLDDDPYAAARVPDGAKRVMTFLHDVPSNEARLPIVKDGVHIVARIDTVVFTAYEPNPHGPVFMKMLETAYGRRTTTRTWDTVRRCTATGAARRP
jgi:uncharacterized protein (DUF1697 family)